MAEKLDEVLELANRDFQRLQPEKPQACLKLALATQPGQQRPVAGRCRGELGIRELAADLSEAVEYAVEQHAASRARLAQRLLDDAEDDGIGDEVAAVHVGFGSEALLGAIAQSGPENVTSCDLGNAEPCGDYLALCAFTRTRRAE